MLDDRDTIRFLLKVCRICYQLLITDQVQVTAVQEEIVTEDSKETFLKFEQFDETVSKLRLENLQICVFHEQSSFSTCLLRLW